MAVSVRYGGGHVRPDTYQTYLHATVENQDTSQNEFSERPFAALYTCFLCWPVLLRNHLLKSRYVFLILIFLTLQSMWFVRQPIVNSFQVPFRPLGSDYLTYLRSQDKVPSLMQGNNTLRLSFFSGRTFHNPPHNPLPSLTFHVAHPSHLCVTIFI